jgi:multidrug efflux pump subunit AcrB
VLSISLSLIAAFTPLIFMDGIVGRLLREFSLTLTFAIVVSTVVSLTITPMICAHYIKEATSTARPGSIAWSRARCRASFPSTPGRCGRCWASRS